MESSRGRKKRNPLNDLRREVAIMRTLRHKNIVALQVSSTLSHWPISDFALCLTLWIPRHFVMWTAVSFGVAEARHCLMKASQGQELLSTSASEVRLCKWAVRWGQLYREMPLH